MEMIHLVFFVFFVVWEEKCGSIFQSHDIWVLLQAT